MKKVIILTSKGGEGLLSGSKAIADGLKNRYQGDVDISIVDFFETFGSIGKPFTRLYNLLLRKSLWINAIYVKIIHTLRLDSWFFFYRNVYPKFKRFLEKEKPDAIVITSKYLVSFISHYKENHPGKPIIFVGNIDPGSSCVPLWFGKKIDKHLIPTPECFDAYQKTGFDLDRAIQTKLVVRSQFKKASQLSQQSLREKYGLPSSSFIVLFTGSREGLEAFIPLITHVLNESDVHCMVICGSNESLRSKLSSLPQTRLSVIGWTNKTYEYLRASDLVVSKPGKQTMKETIVSHVPMISLCYPKVMDQEKGNLEYMYNRNILIEGRSLQDIVEKIRIFSKNSELYQSHVNRLQEISAEIDSDFVAQAIWKEIA